MNRQGRAGVALLAALNGGCSVLFVKAPRADLPSEQKAECTDSGVVPTIDLLVGLGTGLGGFLLVEDSSRTNKEPALALWLSAATIYTVSAIAGYVAVSRCNDFKAELDDQPLHIRPPRRRPPPPPVPANPGPGE